MKIPETTIKLNKPGLKFRRDILKNFQFDEVHDFERLNLACHCLDRIHACRDLMEKEGLFILDRFGISKPHPASDVEQKNKSLFIRLLRELNLDLTKPKDLRGPALY